MIIAATKVKNVGQSMVVGDHRLRDPLVAFFVLKYCCREAADVAATEILLLVRIGWFLTVREK